MNLLYIELRNIGPFKGIQKISLSSFNEKFINIVVGSNGSGKSVLLNSILWALGFNESTLGSFSEKNWIHRGCRFGSVKLRFQIEEKIYEIIRTVSKPKELENYIAHDFQINLIDGPVMVPINDPNDFIYKAFSGFNDLITLHLLLFDPEPHIKKSDINWLNYSGFKDWVTDRLTKVEFSTLTNIHRRYIISAAVEQIGGLNSFQAAGEMMIGRFLLNILFQEWLLDTDQLPYGLKQSNTLSFPWLMDSPFNLLDVDYQIALLEILQILKRPVLLCTSGNINFSLERIISEKIGSLSVIKVGWNLPGNGNMMLFGQSLELSRCDKSDYSELVSHDVNSN